MRRREFTVGLSLSMLAATVRAQPAATRYKGRLFDGHLHLNWKAVSAFRSPRRSR